MKTSVRLLFANILFTYFFDHFQNQRALDSLRYHAKNHTQQEMLRYRKLVKKIIFLMTRQSKWSMKVGSTRVQHLANCSTLEFFTTRNDKQLSITHIIWERGFKIKLFSTTHTFQMCNLNMKLKIHSPFS